VDVDILSGATANTTITNTYQRGKLDVTKLVDRNGADQSLVSGSFTVNVTGPAPSTANVGSHTFNYSGGSVDTPNPWELTNLVPGDYTVTETNPAPAFLASPNNGVVTVSVPAGGYGNTTITNTYQLGKLDVTKIVDRNGAAVGLVSGSFTVNVTGPAPSTANVGSHTFNYSGGSVDTPNPWELTNLVPGSYTVTETNPGTAWAVGTNPVTVSVPAGGTGNRSITNTYKHGSLRVTKWVNWNGLDNTIRMGVTKDFVVTVTGPSYLGGIQHVFRVENGNLLNFSPYDNPWDLLDLIPGDYSVLETPPGGNWVITSGSGVTVTVNPAQQSTADIYNDYLNGGLTVTKVVHMNGADPNAVGLDGTFSVTVAATPSGSPSYTHVFNMNNGVIVSSLGHENPWTLTGLPPGNYAVSEANPGTLWSISGTGQVSVVANATATAIVTNDYIPHPKTVLLMNLSTHDIPAGGGPVNIVITEFNSGDTQLDSVSIDFIQTPPGTTTYLNSSSPGFSGDNGNGKLDMGETWRWQFTVTVTVDTNFAANGHGQFVGGTAPVDESLEHQTDGVSIPRVPGISDLGLGILIAGFAGAMIYLRRRKSSKA